MYERLDKARNASQERSDHVSLDRGVYILAKDLSLTAVSTQLLMSTIYKVVFSLSDKAFEDYVLRKGVWRGKVQGKSQAVGRQCIRKAE